MQASQKLRIKTRGDGRVYARKGSANLWCAYFLRSKEYRESTGTSDPQSAVKFLKRRLKEVGADQIGKATFLGPQQDRIKVSKLLDALEADYKLRDKDSPQFRSHLKHIRDYFGAWRAIEVSPEAVDKYIVWRQASGSAAATINRSTQLLAQAFRLAVDRRHLATAPQIRHLSEKGNARQGFFSDVEVHALMEHLPNYLRDFVQFGYLTGWRRGEIASLRWSDVEGDVVRLRGENSKNGEARAVTLSGDLRHLFELRGEARQIKTKGGVELASYIFHRDGAQVGDFRKAWSTACVAAGLGRYVCDCCKHAVSGRSCESCGVKAQYTGRIFHDFRRTAVRNMVRAGVPERVAMTISGHKTRAIFDRYNIVNEADLREAMDRTQGYLKDCAQQPNQPTLVQMKAAQS